MQDLEMLDEDELAAFKRGRNAKSHTHAKTLQLTLTSSQLDLKRCLDT